MKMMLGAGLQNTATTCLNCCDDPKCGLITKISYLRRFVVYYERENDTEADYEKKDLKRNSGGFLP